MTNLDSRDMTLPTKVHLIKAMVFPVVMYGCESWTVKKAECWKIDAFELWCWKRLLRVPWTARRSNQSILKDQSWVFIGRTDAEAETSILWSLHAKSWLIGKDPDSGRDWGQEEKGDDRGWDGWMASPTRWTWVWVNSGSLWWPGRPGVLWFMGSQRVGDDWATELNWNELNFMYLLALSDIWVVSGFGAYMPIFLLGIYPGMELVGRCSTYFQRPWIMPISYPTSSKWDFLLRHILWSIGSVLVRNYGFNLPFIDDMCS